MKAVAYLKWFLVSTLGFACLRGERCRAQAPPAPEQPWSSRPVLRIWPGAAPGSDPLVEPFVLRLFNALRDNGGKPEFHVYRAGMHGFSMKQRGSSDHWLQELWWWMETYGLTGQP